MEKKSGAGRRLLVTGEIFQFACNPGLECFTRCCRNADMYLYPYDVIRMKNRLGMSSGEFLDAHTVSDFRDNEYFPSVMLKMSDQEDRACPFLTGGGCSIYEDRPFSCRAYPLEPAISMADGAYNAAYFIMRHEHCLGHGQGREWTADDWIRDQDMGGFNAMNAHWVEMDALFRSNPWGDQGVNSPALKMAAMACFDVDRFREFVFQSTFLSRFDVPGGLLQKARESDEGMMLLGFDWVKSFLAGTGAIRPRQ